MGKENASPNVDVSIAVVSYNSYEKLSECIASIYRFAAGCRHEIIIVDNASSDHSAEKVQNEYPEVILIKNTCNVGFSRAVNAAFRASSGRYFFLLNPDAVLIGEIFPGMIDFFKAHPDAGIVAPKIVFPDMSLQPSSRRFISLFGALLDIFQIHLYFPENAEAKRFSYDNWRHDSVRKVHWVIGAALMTPRGVFRQCGMMDERFFMYFEDMDYCKNLAQSGYKTYFCPQFTVVHHHAKGGSDKLPVRKVDYYISLYRYLIKHKGRLGAAVFRIAMILWGCLYLAARTGMFFFAPHRYALRERIDIPLRIIFSRSCASG